MRYRIALRPGADHRLGESEKARRFIRCARCGRYIAPHAPNIFGPYLCTVCRRDIATATEEKKGGTRHV